MNDLLRGILVGGVLLLAWLCSENRRAVNWRLVLGGLALQLVLICLFLVVPGADRLFSALADFFVAVTDFTKDGARFVFGGLADQTVTNGAFGAQNGFIFAFQALPTIIFFSALCSVLYYVGILQRVVWAFAWVTKKFMRLSGAESLAAAAEIFLGQTESPLMIKPYVGPRRGPSCSRSWWAAWPRSLAACSWPTSAFLAKATPCSRKPTRNFFSAPRSWRRRPCW